MERSGQSSAPSLSVRCPLLRHANSSCRNIDSTASPCTGPRGGMFQLPGEAPLFPMFTETTLPSSHGDPAVTIGVHPDTTIPLPPQYSHCVGQSHDFALWHRTYRPLVPAPEHCLVVLRPPQTQTRGLPPSTTAWWHLHFSVPSSSPAAYILVRPATCTLDPSLMQWFVVILQIHRGGTVIRATHGHPLIIPLTDEEPFDVVFGLAGTFVKPCHAAKLTPSQKKPAGKRKAVPTTPL